MAVSIVSGVIAVVLFIMVIVGFTSTPRRVVTGPQPRPTFAQPVDAELEYHPANNPAPARAATPAATAASPAPSQAPVQSSGSTAAPAPTDNNPYTAGR